jgi:undecaprenyl-diphosphatase
MMNKKIFLQYIQFVAVVFGGVILAILCNRFLDYPISSWFCVNKFNVIESPSILANPNSSGGVVENINVTKNTGGVQKVESDSASQLVDKSDGKIAGKLKKRLAGWILILEFFGHPLCFLVVLALCFLLDYGRRRNLFRFIFCVMSSQILAAAIKILICRKRPVVNDFSISSFDLTGFVGRDDIHSFPSAHTALAFSLAFALAWSYPRGRYLFYLLAVGVAFERIFDCRHYLSDTIIGGLIAYIVWFFCYKTSFVASLFNYFELKSDSNVESSLESGSRLKAKLNSASKSDSKSDSKSKMESIQNKRNDNSKPTILFSVTSLGSSSVKRFNSGIHQFLKSSDKQIDHNERQQLSPTQRETPATEQVSSQNKSRDKMQNQQLQLPNQSSNSPRVSKFENIASTENQVTDDVNDAAKIDQLQFQPKPPQSPRRRNNLPFEHFRK